MFVAAMKNALLPRPHILGGPPGCNGSACPPPQGSSPSLTPPTRPSARRDDVSPSSTALCMDQEANRQVTALAPTQAHICMWTAHRDLQPWSSHLRARHRRLNRVLQKRNVLPPSSCEYDHFWKKGLAYVLMMRSYGIQWALNPLTGIIHLGKETHRRDWRDVASSRGKSWPACKDAARKRQGADCPLEPLKRKQPSQDMDFGFLASRISRINFCCFSCSVCDTLFRQLGQTNTEALLSVPSLSPAI